MPATTVSPTLKWDVLVTNRQGLVRDLPPGKEQWAWVPTSAILIFGQRDAVLVDAFLTIEQAAALVEWVAAMKSGCERMATSAGRVVATPVIDVSPMARSMRRRAASRSWPQTTSLATRLS